MFPKYIPSKRKSDMEVFSKINYYKRLQEKTQPSSISERLEACSNQDAPISDFETNFKSRPNAEKVDFNLVSDYDTESPRKKRKRESLQRKMESMILQQTMNDKRMSIDQLKVSLLCFRYLIF